MKRLFPRKPNCWVNGCISGSYLHYPAPYNDEREWAQRIGRLEEAQQMSVLEIRSMGICRDHFEKKYLRGVYQLTKNAVPSMNLPETIVTEPSVVQKTKNYTSNDEIPYPELIYPSAADIQDVINIFSEQLQDVQSDFDFDYTLEVSAAENYVQQALGQEPLEELCPDFVEAYFSALVNDFC